MSQQWALTWNVKPGSEEEVARLFVESGRPEHAICGPDGEEIGKLLRTSVFMRGNQVVRIIEFDGLFLDVAQHMSRQREVRELEERLDEHLEVGRDMSSPQAAAAFFASASMRCVLSRSHDGGSDV